MGCNANPRTRTPGASGTVLCCRGAGWVLQFLLEVSRVFGRFYLASIVLPTFLTAVGHSIDTSTLHPKTGQRIACECAGEQCPLVTPLGIPGVYRLP